MTTTTSDCRWKIWEVKNMAMFLMPEDKLQDAQCCLQQNAQFFTTHTHTHTHTHSKYCFVIVRLGLVVSETQQLLSIVQPTRSAASWLSLVTSLMNRAELTLCRERTHTHTHTHTPQRLQCWDEKRQQHSDLRWCNDCRTHKDHKITR